MTSDPVLHTSRPRPSYDPTSGRRRRLARRRAARGRRRLWAGAALSLDALLMGLFGAGYAARYVPPTSGWPLQVTALALPPASVLVAASAVGWTAWAARTRSRWAWAGAAVHLGLVVLAAGRYGPGLLREGGVPEVHSGTLRALSLNAGDDLPRSVPLAADVAQLEAPDVAAFQEASVGVVRESDDGQLGGSRALLGLLFDGAYRSWSSLEDSRLVVIAKEGVPVEVDVSAPLDPVPLEGPGVVGRFTSTWEGRPFALYVVHFRSFQREETSWTGRLRDLREDFLARGREAEFLRAALDVEELPFLVLGDFNATPDQWSYAHVARDLHDALAERAGWAPTFPDRRPLVQIDAVLASPHWTVEAARVLPGGLSDHRGVVADLRWATPAPDDLNE